jgi:hypothetical protein
MTIDPDPIAPGTRCESCGGDTQTGHQRLCKVLCDKYLPHVKEREYPSDDFNFDFEPDDKITLKLTKDQYETLCKELRKYENLLYIDRTTHIEDCYSEILEEIEKQGDPQNAKL